MADPIDFPVELVSINFTRTIVESLPDHKPSEDSVRVGAENAIRVEPIEHLENSFMFVMRSQFNAARDPSQPYSIDMECFAILKVKNQLVGDKDESIKAVTITGHSVVYGAIREAVLWLTSRHPYGPLTLGLSVLQNKPSPKEQPKENAPRGKKSLKV